MSYDRTKPRMNHVSISAMVGALLDGTNSIRELVELTGLHVSTIRLFVNRLHQDGHAYIGEWDKDRQGRRNQPCYALGDKEDMPRPPPKNFSQKGHESRARRRLAQIAALRTKPTLIRTEEREMEAA